MPLPFKAFKKREGKVKPIKFAVFDIESTNWTDFQLLGFFNGIEYFEFDSIEKFLAHVLTKKYYGYRIYAHFGGKFDFLFLLDNKKIDYEIVETNGSIIKVSFGFQKYYNNAGEIKYKNYVTFADSYRIIPVSLEKAGNILDTFNKKRIIDYSKIGNNDETKEYLKADVLTLYDVIKKYQELINGIGGNVKLTIASTALDLFQRKYMKENWIFPTYFKHDEKVRSGYYGGRTEVFKNELKSGYYYDINSLYPSVMMKNNFPVGNPVYIDEYRYNDQDEGIIEIECIWPKELNKPLLPVHHNGKMVFPAGRIKGFYPMPFLRKLDEIGINFICHRALIFGKERIFEAYVKDLYEIRLKNKDNSMEFIAKILLNSLYGKFAQRLKRKNFISGLTREDLSFYVSNDIPVYNYNEKNDLWYYETNLEFAYILPAISAYVTAYAQIELYKYLENFDVFYCDTDSIFTTDKIKSSNEIGKMKLVDEIDHAIFISSKFYAYRNKSGEEKIVIKGFPLKLLKQNGIEFGLKDFKFAMENKDFSIFDISYNSVFGFKESLNRKNKFLHYGEKNKSLSGENLKRNYFYCDNTSEPIILK